MALLVTLVSSLAPRHTSRLRDCGLQLEDALPAADVVLPAGFSAAIDRATSDEFVRVVAGDVDRDGDIDVVATLGSLDLAVWQNDGSGHFTRVPSTRHVALQTQPSSPSADGHSPASDEWIQTAQPRGGALDSPRAHAHDVPATSFASFVDIANGRFGPRVRSSRAPPLA
jgi:hypothetical protein